jgi:glycosyltransferase involved in cell wall biosynthesis
VRLDLVICTFNNSAGLDEVLARLSRQHDAALDWSITVVDNACTDDTKDVVAAHAERGAPPIRYVLEPQQGLTPARLRGVRETGGDWIAFVDDDNLLEPGWVAAIGAAVQAHPGAGAIGGRVSLLWDRTPPHSASDFGFCFAEQELGDAPRQVDNLVGAGMVVRREALVASGWTDGPLLADRIGHSLISGGDVEVALRIKAAGYELWYDPSARMLHRMSVGRATRRYLLRMNRALGATAARVSLLAWPGDYESWRAAQKGLIAARLAQAWRGLAWSLRVRRKITGALGWLSFAAGLRSGVAEIARMAEGERKALMGKAAVQAEAAWVEASQPRLEITGSPASPGAGHPGPQHA